MEDIMIVKWVLLALWVLLTVWSLDRSLRQRLARKGRVTLDDFIADLIFSALLGWFFNMAFGMGEVVLFKRKEDDRQH